MKPNAEALLEILGENPFQTPSTYEKLVGDLAGTFCRRINIHHRLVYEALPKKRIVRVLRMCTHCECETALRIAFLLRDQSELATFLSEVKCMNQHGQTYSPHSAAACMLAGFSLLLLLSCGQGSGRESEKRREVLAEAYLVQPEYHAVSIRATGDLLANEDVEIKAPVAGNVRKIHFRESQSVSRGALLVEIDNRSWIAQKKGLEARMISAAGELERKKKLLAMQGVSDEEAERAEAEVGSLKAQIEGLDVMIDLAAVRAPFAGRLGMRNFSPGAYLSQGSVITRLVQTDKVKVNFTIPTKYAAQAGNGRTVKVISSSGGDTASAEIYAVNPRISPSSRSLQVRAILNTPPPSFIPGDFVQVLLEVERKTDALLVPAECIVPELKTQSVFVVRDGKAQRREVETGSRTEDRVEILRGLSPGDTVLTTGLMEVKEGDRVELQKLHGSRTR